MEKALITLLGLLFAAQLQAAGPPAALAALPDTARLVLPALDAAKALAEDDASWKDGQPLRYAISHAVDARAGQAAGSHTGVWSTLPDGRAVWRLGLEAPGALAIDVGFDRFRLPHGAELWLVGEGKVNTAGPFTDAHNPPGGGTFWTPRVSGPRAELQLVLPAGKRPFLELALATVNQAYRDVTAPLVLAKSGSCNIDVACPEGDDWEEEIRSVAHYTFQDGGSYVCTGQLAASTAPALDASQPLFLTAHHCVSTAQVAQSMVFYWRYEAPTCRTPGSAQSGQPLPRDSNIAAKQSGATLLATHPASDFTVVRLNAPVPSAAQAVWSGWDRTGATPAGSVGIHHPQGDEKRISFNDDPLTKGPNCIVDQNTGSTHWYVNDWELGTTEKGSSGSGLWDPDTRLLVGVLTGGRAACGRLDYDCYGRLDAAWDGGGTPATRMRDWLDRGNTGATTLAGGTGTPACQLTLASPAFATPPRAGDSFTITATTTGGSGPYTYSWDLDDDGIVDRSGPEASVTLSYPGRTSTQVRVSVSATGCSGSASAALDVLGPALSASAGAPQQLCGNGDAVLDPGERWRLPVTLRNTGNGAFASNGRALFAPAEAGIATSFGPDGYGYTAATGADGCGFAFVDIASGASAVAPLPLVPASTFATSDEGRIATAVALMPGMRVFGQTVTQAVMSTNGYISFSNAESGGDYDPSCPLNAPDRGSQAPRLHVFHDDLEVQPGGGLRHRWFDACPRPSDSGAGGGCHVFQWDDVTIIGETSSFDFQALLYPGNDQLVYQYRSVPPDAGGFASIGLVGAAAGQGLSISCMQPEALAAGDAICIFDKDAQPGAAAAVTVETPAPALTTLAAGASTTLNLDLHIPADAACGTPLAVDFLGAANATQSAPAASRVLDARIGNGGSCRVGSCSAQVPQVDARYGLFYQHARSGNGLLNFVYDQPGDEDIYGAVWYTARPDRSPQWYTVQGPHRANLGLATIHRFSNQVAPGGFDPEGEVVGRAFIAQPARDDVVFAWRFDDGRQGIELLHSAGLPFASPNRTQQWYALSESGWGAGVESNQLPDGGYNEFWATFIYDAAGDGRWVVGSSGQRQGTVPLVAYQVHCPGCPRLADALQRPRPAGSLSRQWQALDRGLLDTDILLPSPLSGSWLRDALPIVPLGPVEQP